MCILIVDSQPLFRRGIIDVLIGNNILKDTKEAGNVVEAKKAMNNQEIQTAIVGLHFEKEFGFDLLSFMKKFYREVKIIALTSNPNLQDFSRVKDMEVEGYLLKDIKPEDLLYAYKVVERGEHFYSSWLLEKTLFQPELEELNKLTDREKEVFRQLCLGLSNTDIGKNLFITEATTKKHISNILNKLHLSNRVEAIFYAKKLAESHIKI